MMLPSQKPFATQSLLIFVCVFLLFSFSSLELFRVHNRRINISPRLNNENFVGKIKQIKKKIRTHNLLGSMLYTMHLEIIIIQNVDFHTL